MRSLSREKLEEDARTAKINPPDVRIGKISETGFVKFRFSNKMVITDEFKTRLMPNKTEGAEDIAAQLEAILRIDLVSADKEETFEKSHMTWRVSNVTNSDLTIQVEFKDPSKVSQGYNPDVLLAFYDFSEVEDIYGSHLPPFDYAKRDIPPQFKAGKMTEALDSLAQVSSAVIVSAAASNGILSYIMMGSLSQLWGMINSLQIVVYLPLFGQLNYPSNASLFNGYLL